MADQISNNVEHELQLLEAIASEPETTQADLAAQVGVAVGTVNWYLKRWSKKGYVKIRRISRWQWSYLLTPEGIARKTRLAGEYVEASLRLYRRTRQQARQLLQEVHAQGSEQLILMGEGEIADICRLTCLEMGINLVTAAPTAPVLKIEGVQLTLTWPEQTESAKSEEPYTE
ncbi:MAG: winged helix-turn-helix transcriptional regulator [Caldilineaceae bacterium]|nr:winged helix-turn-helix transcriptional regulator [Caldilineaceae bacterium]